MADNVTLNSGTGGATLAADDISGIHHQRVKIQYGVDGAATDVSDTNPLPIDDAGGSITVDGTITADAGSGTFTVAGTVTANLGATDNAVLDNIDANTTNLTSAILQDDTAFTPATDYVVMVGAEYDDTTPDSIDEGDAGAVRMSSRRELYIQVRDAAGNERGLNIDANGDIGVTNADLTTLAGAVSGTEMQVDIVSGNVTNAGTFAVQEDGAALTALQLIDDIVFTDDAAFTVATSKGAVMMGVATSDTVDSGDAAALKLDTSRNLAVDLAASSGVTIDTSNVTIGAALPAGTNAIGKLAANSGVDIGDVDVLSIAAGSNLIGDVGLSGARTSGGTTLYKNIDVDESEDQVKGTAGQIYWIHAMNLSSATKFLKIYNATAASVVVGTTVPDLTFPLPTQGDTNGAGFTLSIPNGIAFGTAITIAATTGVADNDSGAPGANEVIVNLGYA